MRLLQKNTLILMLMALLTLSTLSQTGYASEEWRLYRAGETLTEDIIGAPPDIAVLVAEEEEIQRTEKELAQEELAEIRPIVASLSEQVESLMIGLNQEREARQAENEVMKDLMKAEIRSARKQGFITGVMVPVIGWGLYKIIE